MFKTVSVNVKSFFSLQLQNYEVRSVLTANTDVADVRVCLAVLRSTGDAFRVTERDWLQLNRTGRYRR